MKRRKTAESSELKGLRGESQFYAEAEYADSIFRDARGDREGSIAALKRALEAMPTYAPPHSQHGFGLVSSRENRRRLRVVPIAVIVAEEHNGHLPDYR